jgi:hypothetical protein
MPRFLASLPTFRWFCLFLITLLFLVPAVGDSQAARPPFDLDTPSHGSPDILVNDPSGDVTSLTQLGAELAYNEANGVLCAVYHDSYHLKVQNSGFAGFSSSDDGGKTWIDHGSLSPTGERSSGSPSMVWRRVDGRFYIASWVSAGIGLYDIDPTCTLPTYVSLVEMGAFHRQPVLAADNNPGSPYYGRLYVAWTDENNPTIVAASSADGGQTWSGKVQVSSTGKSKGVWLAVDPVTADVYAAWIYMHDTLGPFDIQVAMSSDGGATWTRRTNPISSRIYPRDQSATTSCGRPALKGRINHPVLPQIAVDQDSNLHIVYTYDQDGADYGDASDIFYRRSMDQGLTWDYQVQINTDSGQADQFFPALAVDKTGGLAIFWNDRRLDPDNLLYDRYVAYSMDGGLTFGPNRRISDESSPVLIDPTLDYPLCFHGDRDRAIATGGAFYNVWGDDRRGDGDIYFEILRYRYSLFLPNVRR